MTMEQAVNHYWIRFNQMRGQPGKGSEEHAWRVFENGQEYLARHVKIQVPSWSELDTKEQKYNIACHGKMIWCSETDTALIVGSDMIVQRNSLAKTLKG